MCNADNVLSFHNRMIDGVLLCGSYTYIAISAADATRQWWPVLSIYIYNKIDTFIIIYYLTIEINSFSP